MCAVKFGWLGTSNWQRVTEVSFLLLWCFKLLQRKVAKRKVLTSRTEQLDAASHQPSPSCSSSPWTRSASYTYSHIKGIGASARIPRFIFGNFPGTNYEAQICIFIHLTTTTTTNWTEYAIHEICIKHFSLKALQMHKSSSPNFVSSRSAHKHTHTHTRRMRHARWHRLISITIEHAHSSCCCCIWTGVKNQKLKIQCVCNCQKWTPNLLFDCYCCPPEIWLINYVPCRARKLSRCVYATYTHRHCPSIGIGIRIGIAGFCLSICIGRGN